MKLWRYIQGFRKGKEAHRIEKEAMRDPFLADALEGYEKVKGNHQEVVGKLQMRITKRSKRKQNYFKAWSIAASVLLVVSLGTWFLVNEWQVTEDLYSVNKPVKPQEAPTAKEAEPVRADSDSIETEMEEQKILPAPQVEVKSNILSEDTHVSEIQDMAEIVVVKSEKRSVMANAVSIINDSIPPGVDTVKEVLAGAMKTQKRETAAAKAIKEKSISPLSATIKGRITDEKGEPIIGASVSISGTNQGTISDTDGYFQITANDGKKLKVNYIGYEPLTLPADTGKMMLIAMHEDRAVLDEVVVVGYGTSKRTVLKTPKPVIGKKAYEEYIKNNLIRPTDDECRDADGKVTLTFHVNSEGRPYNINIKKSLCPSADQEAIRLVTEGPEWETEPGEATLKIKF